MKQRLHYWIRVVRTVGTDPRIPDWLRAMIAIALLIKTVPLPDAGIDEVLLLVAGGVLYFRYRNVWQDALLAAQET